MMKLPGFASLFIRMWDPASMKGEIEKKPGTLRRSIGFLIYVCSSAEIVPGSFQPIFSQ